MMKAGSHAPPHSTLPTYILPSLSGFCGAGDMSRAEKCMEQMEADGVAPNLYTYNAMVRGWAMSADSTGKAGRADAKKRWTRSGGGGSPAAVPQRRGEVSSFDLP